MTAPVPAPTPRYRGCPIPWRGLRSRLTEHDGVGRRRSRRSPVSFRSPAAHHQAADTSPVSRVTHRCAPVRVDGVIVPARACTTAPSTRNQDASAIPRRYGWGGWGRWGRWGGLGAGDGGGGWGAGDGGGGGGGGGLGRGCGGGGRGVWGWGAGPRGVGWRGLVGV